MTLGKPAPLVATMLWQDGFPLIELHLDRLEDSARYFDFSCDRAAAKATLQAYEAQLDLARRDLTDADLVAPADGVIEDRILEPGDMASPQKPVLTLALDDPLWIRVYVAETDLPRIRPGMKAWVTTDGFPGRRYEGWVGFISPTAEFTPKSVETLEVRTKLVYQVRVVVHNPQGELRLGMPAVVTLPLDQPAQP